MTTYWGILGTGRIARTLAASIGEAEGAEVVAVASRTQTSADAFAHDFNIPRAYGSYEALLADPQVEVVYIALPNSMHKEWALKTAEAGKHILCEKPIGVDVAEAEAMYAAARQHGVLLTEAFMYRFHPQTLKVQELLAAGTVGAIQLVRASFCFALAAGDTTNVRLNAELAGGSLMDVGCYAVNALRWITGSAPAQVTATARWGVNGVDEKLVASFDYANGVLGQIACGLRASRNHTIQIVGEHGVIEVNEAFTPPADSDTVIQVWRGLREVQRETISIKAVNHYRLQVEGVDRMLESDYTGPAQPMTETLDNMRTITALLQSAHEGRSVDVGT